MAPGRWRQGRRLLRALLLVALLGPAACFSSSFYSPGEPRSSVRVLCGSNWSLVLQGQWMLEFYAPWCPACQQIEATWESFARESERLGITVGKVDVTQEPGLSGRFFVTTLPTIYHANDGVFRRYRGSRTLEDLQGYILERKWEAVEPVAGWKSPSSIMMHGMAGLFHFSGWIRQIHNYLTGTLGVHVWISYAIFILATLLIGLLLGLVLVLISDCLCPAKSKHSAETPGSAAGTGCRGSCAEGEGTARNHPCDLLGQWGQLLDLAPGFLLLQVSYLRTEQLQGLGCLPLTLLFFFSTVFISGCKVEVGMVSNEALGAFCLLSHQLLLVLFCDVRI
ncbi:thioredoxin-related transmembrane protein 4 isoform X1 [Onychostruthus taczanowskii]|uniref:thioredoxin-related transmembrane protein 4 isoform X1 n=1 Tax=Onychostruthus taczanowskii TaxID=356909 RepID=UPI001B801D03|nr:thioredoxin-related transmembrane protein 4 isoform X1 [Onychostruthus taczanowskii]